jgi:hypothetical protein
MGALICSMLVSEVHNMGNFFFGQSKKKNHKMFVFELNFHNLQKRC